MKSNLLITLFLLTTLISSCKYCQGQVDGGPCSYETKLFPAEVIDIFKIDSTYSEVYFLIKNYRLTDEDIITYSSEFSGYINTDTLQKKEIKIGSLFTYEIKDILTGHCSPHLERLLLIKYE
ncbi:MAG: hypothetical protein ACKVQB_00410 [Bacteroidia bacterium]